MKACGHCCRALFTVKGNLSSIGRAQTIEIDPPVAGPEGPSEKAVMLGKRPEEQITTCSVITSKEIVDIKKAGSEDTLTEVQNTYNKPYHCSSAIGELAGKIPCSAIPLIPQGGRGGGKLISQMLEQLKETPIVRVTGNKASFLAERLPPLKAGVEPRVVVCRNNFITCQCRLCNIEW